MAKLDRIYIGFTKDGKERCLIKFYELVIEGKVRTSHAKFIDIETGEKFYNSDIDKKSLISFSKIYSKYKNRKRLSKRKVKKVYQIDRDTLLEIKYLVYGELSQIRLKDKLKTIVSDLEFKSIDKNLLLLASSRKKLFTSLQDNHVYQKGINFIDYKYLSNIRQISLEEEIMSKRKVLELNYKNKLPVKESE